MHYMRLYRRGTTHKPTTQERFWASVEQTPTCWLWRGYVNRGYGWFKLNGRPQCAHRLSYQWLVGAIPEGLQIDHLCRVKNCVNPGHLEAVTAGVNTRRVPDHPIVLNAMKTHCPADHEYNLLNTRFGPDGRRYCRTCHRDAERERRASKRKLPARTESR